MDVEEALARADRVRHILAKGRGLVRSDRIRDFEALVALVAKVRELDPGHPEHG